MPLTDLASQPEKEVPVVRTGPKRKVPTAGHPVPLQARAGLTALR